MNCPNCGKKVVRIDKYDSYACKECDVWLEKQCADPACNFCRSRDGLEKPSNAPEEVWSDPWNT